jgi:hypothetical protein
MQKRYGAAMKTSLRLPSTWGGGVMEADPVWCVVVYGGACSDRIVPTVIIACFCNTPNRRRCALYDPQSR